jgi:hypothetical protein
MNVNEGLFRGDEGEGGKGKESILRGEKDHI